MIITLKEKSRNLDKLKAVIEANASRTPPKWLEYDGSAMVAKVASFPQREDIDIPIEEQLIVEFYSK
jgi:small subunit ribosomal protein S4